MPDTEGELVLLIHGTFAAPEKGKLKWWEIDSNRWQEIQKRLPKGTRLADRKEIFHWSGDNQERDRYQAGMHLLDRLLKLEKQGRPYHLVGHSHGGSVIWHAMQEAVRRRIGRRRPDPRLQLSNLRSWATIGTPFLQFNESGMGRWPGAILTRFFFIVSWVLTLFLVYTLWTLKEHVRWVDNYPYGSAIAFVTAFAIAAVPGLALHVWVTAIRREALSIRQTAFVRNQAMLEFGDRWLGMWSREDEAISGLKSSVRLQIQLLPKLQFRPNRVFQYDRRIWSYRFLLRWLLAPILNRFIPIGNGVIASTMSKTAQGDDRPGCHVTSVSEGPICLHNQYQYPTLPHPVDVALVESANTHLIAKSPDFIPKVRTLLADYSSGVALLGGGIKNAGFEFDGNELVHTSYFDHDGVLDLLAHHVQVHGPDPAQAQRRDDGLGKWYRAARFNVKGNVTDLPIVQKHSLTYLGKRNRLALFSVVLSLLALTGLLAASLARLVEEEDVYLAFGGGACALVLFGLLFGRIGQLRAERGARLRRTASLGVNLGLLWFALAAIVPVMTGVNWVTETYFSKIPFEVKAVVKNELDQEVVAVAPSDDATGKGFYFVTNRTFGLYSSKDKKTKSPLLFSEITSCELRVPTPNVSSDSPTAKSELIIKTATEERKIPLPIQNRTDLRFFATIQDGATNASASTITVAK